MVRGLGPRVSLRHAQPRRPGVRQSAAAPDHARVVHAPERPAARVRVGLRRRQPAGARARGAGRVPQRRRHATSTGWSGSSTSCCSASPGGRTSRTPKGDNLFGGGFLGMDNVGPFDRSAPLPPGAGARAGRRDRLDGALLPEHARDRARAGRSTTPPTRTSRSSSSSTYALIAEAINDRGLWDEADGFYYDQVRRTSDAHRVAGARAVDDRAAPAVRGGAIEHRDLATRLPEFAARVHGLPAACTPSTPRACQTGEPATRGRDDVGARRPRPAAAGARAARATRASSSRAHGLRSLSAAYRGAAVRALAGRARDRRASTTSRPSRRRRCSAATRTGAARSGSRSTTS